MSSSSSRAEPIFQEVSPSSGQAYLKAIRVIVIQDYACLLSLMQGTMPTEMLEFVETVYPDKLGRRAGTFRDMEGNPSVVNQSMNQYRESLILDRINEGVDRAGAIELLFPENQKQARERTRQSINSSLQSLFGKIAYLWPRDDIQTLMQADAGLVKADLESDLLRWYQAFLKFCLTSSGNSEVNIKQAESKISNLRMKHDGYLEYAEAFKLASENLKMCKSTFTEERIVALYFENLDQSQDRFFRWHKDFLTVFHPLNSYRVRTLAEAMTLTQQHYDQVIRATARSDIRTEKQPKHDQASQPTALAMVTTPSGKKRKSESPAKASKTSKVKSDNSNKTSGVAPNGATTSTVCNRYSSGTCTFGAKCRFLHIKEESK